MTTPATGPGSPHFPPLLPALPKLDGGTFDMAQRLLQCLCETLTHTLAGAVCRCCLYFGEGVVPADYCCGCEDGSGMAAVKVYRIAPATTRFPQQDFEVRQNCNHNAYVVTLEMTVYRCVAVLDQHGEAPNCEALMYDTAVQLDDAAAMRRTLRCCFGPQLGDGSVLYSSTGRYVEDDTNFVGPDGDCAGVRMRTHVEFFDSCDCDQTFPITG